MTRNLLLTQHYLRAVLVLLMLAALSVQSLLAQNRRGTPLPEGHGKELVEQACTSCHTISAITRSGFDGVEMWRSVQESMIELPESDAVRIAEYLAEHFPAREDRKPTLVDGPVEIDIQEWIVPTLGQRSRDPVEAPDGSIWWTGMWASLVGRLDPVTGTMEEYPLPPEARPHSIIPDDEGYIWYTGNSNGTIGKLDPETGEITEYPTEAGDPHTAVFHPNGKLYFTSQRAAMLGRLDPETGELTEIPTEPRPYGIIVAQNGTVWIAYNGTNKLASMDPESMELRYYTISDEGTRIRRLGIDSKGIIWYVNSTMGRIGRLDPSTGEFKEWDSPSGPRSHPYSLAVINDKIWYNESRMRPDALVRFDPETESFQSWATPSGVGIIRHVWVTRENKLLIHQSSSNRVGLVTIKDLAN
ncbi:MAG: cytochrome C [Bacteroidota bacterium]|nr:cytochrome C [Bacteroidota bacterium]MDE2645918.1 cytochrome C [Bacteroidota bacterium]